MRILRYSSILSFILAVIVVGACLAANFDDGTGSPDDTPAGATVTSTGTNNKANYRDVNLNPRDTVSGANTFSRSVTAEYGLAFPAADSNDATTTRGVPHTFSVKYKNAGNAPITFTFTVETVSSNAVGWTVKIYETTVEGNSVEITYPRKVTMAEDDIITYEVVMTPSTEVADSPDQSYTGLISWLTMESDYPQAGSEQFVGIWYWYTGVNGKTYGGMSGDLTLYPDDTRLTIRTSIMTMTRTATVDSPGEYTLGVHDPVPGALYTMNILVTDEGTGNANNVVVIDKVPANMVAYKLNVIEPEDNVDVTAPGFSSVGGSGWNFYYTVSSEVELDRSYDGAGWILLGLADDETSIPSSATFVKWQASALGGTISDPPAGSWGNLQWSCYIK